MNDIEQRAHDLAVVVATEQMRVSNDAKLRLSPSGKPVDITINTGDLLKWYKATYEALVEELSSSAE